MRKNIYQKKLRIWTLFTQREWKLINLLKFASYLRQKLATIPTQISDFQLIKFKVYRMKLYQKIICHDVFLGLLKNVSWQVLSRTPGGDNTLLLGAALQNFLGTFSKLWKVTAGFFDISLTTFWQFALQIKWQVSITAWKVLKYGDFSGSYFPIFELNTEL